MRWSTTLPWLIAPLALQATARSDPPGPKQKVTTFSSDILGLVYFDDSDTIVFPDIASGKVWQSTDAGFEWEELKNVEDAIEIIQHPYDRNVAIILGGDLIHYITKDQGKSWNEFKTPSPVKFMGRPISFHGADSDRILIQAADCEDIWCKYPVYYTTDGFSTKPKELHRNVISCLWAKSTDRFTTGQEDLDEDRILCNVEGEFSFFESDARILMTDDYFKTAGVEPLIDGDRSVSGIINIASVTGYLAVAAKSVGSDELALYVTDDTELWHRAEFGNHSITESAYTILESTNYSMQVDVLTQTSPPVGALFTSNSNGTFFTRTKNHTNRNINGYVDFEKVANIPGIVLVNEVVNWEEVEDDSKTAKEIVTRISFDDGRTWQPLSLDKKRDIHLHSVTEQVNTGRIFSSPAPGIVMGVGNTGKYLKARKDGDTYVSDDGGLTWKDALLGPHLYEMGDSGSILVAVEDGTADKISWSLNHGSDWDSAPLDHKIEPFALMTTPDSTSLTFLVIGRNTKKGADEPYEIIAFDFSKLLDRTCDKSDFEEWVARVDEKGEPACLMGHTRTFRRRKAEADCFIRDKFNDIEAKTEKCLCTEQDYECDYNFVKNSTGHCEPIGVLTAPKGACSGDDKTYEGSSGYRLIPGNDCDHSKGVQLDEPITRQCEDTTTPPPSGDINSTITTSAFKKDGMFEQYFYLERCEKCTGTDETIVTRTDKKTVYVTHDHGKHWETLPNVKDDIEAIYPHHYFTDQVFFTTKKKKLYYSKDRAQTIHNFDTPEPPVPHRPALSFHPKKPDWLIWNGITDGQSVAQVSRKHGDSWKLLLRSVNKCEFVYSDLRPNSTELIFCEQYEGENERNNLTLVGSNDWFQDDMVELQSDIVDFATMAEYIVVAFKTDNGGLKVDASVDGQTFADAHFPPNFEIEHQSAYTVLDSSTHSVFLHVTVSKKAGSEYGSIIKSNSNGTDYILAISDVNRDEPGYIDFEKVLGLEGISVVNVVSNVKDAIAGENKRLKTYITHNDGADWATIARPERSNGFDVDWCTGGQDVCSLHLHGYTERDDPRRTYSSPTAIGLLIAHGNVGDFLGDVKDANTFMSTDGGVEWTMIQEGTWGFAYGDRGSIISIVETHKPVKIIKYTLDEGTTWINYQFSDDAMVVDRITTVPSDTSRNFLLWGSIDDKLTTVNIDFSGLKERSEKCSLDEKNPESDKDDYYLWTPKHPLSKTDCLFGHRAKYHRKLASKNCYNGQSLPTLHDISETCECTRQDFECDYNYERQVDGSCALVPGLSPADPKEVCYKSENVTEYYGITGYRRIPLTTCKGGMEYDLTPQSRPCDGHEDEWNQKHGLSGAGLFFAIVIPIAAAAAAGWYVWRNWDGKFGRIQLGDGAVGSRIGLGGAFDGDAPWIKYPVLAISALAAVVVAIPMVASAVWRSVSTRFGRSGGRYGSYGAARPYTSRNSFQRGRGNYSVVDPDEGELLGDESEDEET